MEECNGIGEFMSGIAVGGVVVCGYILTFIKRSSNREKIRELKKKYDSTNLKR